MKIANIKNDPFGIKIGVSAAASWAWGTSLVVGMDIAQTRGAAVFAIWAIANTLTLTLFAILMNKGVIKPHVFDNLIIKIFAIVIQMFCLIIQLNIINQTLGTYISDPLVTYLITSAIGIAFVLMVARNGLPLSVKADIVKWGIAIAAIVIIIAIGVLQGARAYTFAIPTADDYLWGWWSALILLSGLIGDVQHWQRAISDKSRKGYYWGTLFFGIYMVLIFTMAHFHFNDAMNAVLLVAVLAVTVSTINSIAVAMHEVGSRKIGTLVSIGICLAWGLGVGIGIVTLWSNFGVVRVCFAAIIIVSSLVIASYVKDKDASKKIANPES